MKKDNKGCLCLFVFNSDGNEIVKEREVLWNGDYTCRK